MIVQKPLVLFDGYCNLCNGTVDFLLKHDRKKQFVMLSLQSDEAHSLLEKFDVSLLPDSVVYIENEVVYVKSDAIIAIARKLSYPWKLTIILKIFPIKFRNKIYDFVAAKRLQWFGKRSSCRIIK